MIGGIYVNIAIKYKKWYYIMTMSPDIASHCYDPWNMTRDQIEAEFDKHGQYHGQRFTGKEKIQMVVDEISNKYDELIVGDTIEIRSLDFHYNFDPIDQEEVLKLLQNVHNCINYNVSQFGEDRSKVDPWKVEKLRMSEECPFPHFTLEGTKTSLKAIDARRFSVKVLDNFRDEIQKLGTAQEIAYELKRSKIGDKLYFNEIPLGTIRPNFAPDEMLEAAFSSNGNLVKQLEFQGKNIHKLLNDLKLKKPLWSLFFAISKDGFRFTPKITKSEVAGRRIDTNSLEEEIEKLRKTLCK